MLHWLTGITTCMLILLNTLIGIGPMLLLGIFKVLIPHPAFRRWSSHWIMWIAETWAQVNQGIFRLMIPTIWDIRCDSPLHSDRSYLVVSNHQSWVDIAALVQAFNRKTPFFKFFLKQQLIWVPFLGLAFWALDYPFMKRYSKAHLDRHPEDRGKDLEITRRACEKFKELPVTIVNFLEGTRLTAAKHQAQSSPYKHLLNPKSGGIAFATAVLGPQMSTVLDVTIVYPQSPPPGFWSLLSGQVPKVIVDIRSRTLPPDLFNGDYRNDPVFRNHFQDWVNQLWQDKDQRISQLQDQLKGTQHPM